MKLIFDIFFTSSDMCCGQWQSLVWVWKWVLVVLREKLQKHALCCITDSCCITVQKHKSCYTTDLLWNLLYNTLQKHSNGACQNYKKTHKKEVLFFGKRSASFLKKKQDSKGVPKFVGEKNCFFWFFWAWKKKKRSKKKKTPSSMLLFFWWKRSTSFPKKKRFFWKKEAASF